MLVPIGIQPVKDYASGFGTVLRRNAFIRICIAVAVPSER